MTVYFTEKLIIKCVPDFASYWSQTTIADLFYGNDLILYVKRGDYATTSEGEGIKLETGYSQSFATISPLRLGFRANIRDTREDLKIAIDELANSTQQDCQLTPITIHDYLFLKNREDRDRGYHIRTGVFVGELENLGGSVSNIGVDCGDRVFPAYNPLNSDRRTTGFAFKFVEQTLAYNF